MSIIGTSVFRSSDYPSQTTHSEHVFALTPTTCGQSGLWSRRVGGGLIVCHWFRATLSINWLMITAYARCTSQSHLHQGDLCKHARPQFYSQSFFFIVFRVHLKLLYSHQRSLWTYIQFLYSIYSFLFCIRYLHVTLDIRRENVIN